VDDGEGSQRLRGPDKKKTGLRWVRPGQRCNMSKRADNRKTEQKAEE